MLGPLLKVQMWFCVASARDSAPCQKLVKCEGFCNSFKDVGRRGTFEEDLPRCISRCRRNTRDMFIRDVRRSGRWFPERGCIFWSIRSSGLLRWFASQVQHFVWPGLTFSWQAQYFRQMEWKNHKMHWYEAVSSAILLDRCSTQYDLASLFRGRRNNLDRWNGKITKCIGTRPSALNSFFWRQSRKIASFLMLPTSKIEEVSQNCFVFDVVKFENWGSLAELLRFWRCQFRKLRKSRRIASFLTLSISKIEEVLQNCFVFDIVKFKNSGSLAELRFWCFQVQTWMKSRRIASFSSLSITLHYTIPHYTTLELQLQMQMQTYYATCRYTNNTTLRYTTLRYTNYTTLIH